MLRDVPTLDTCTTLAGRAAAWLAVVGPRGISGIFRRDAEEACAPRA
ncbi:hypothetical protein BCAR13_790063 [Paraburkholderia caribensis]|nr:hypothetical protein BCAR13_790063 [Paraburkholderia caribensis]